MKEKTLSEQMLLFCGTLLIRHSPRRWVSRASSSFSASRRLAEILSSRRTRWSLENDVTTKYWSMRESLALCLLTTTAFTISCDDPTSIISNCDSPASRRGTEDEDPAQSDGTWPMEVSTSEDLDWIASPLRTNATATRTVDALLHDVHRDDMVDAYVKSLTSDHGMVLLPLGMGKSSPIFMDLFGLNRTLVLEAISALEMTIQQWNEPQFQVELAGHPIIYEFGFDGDYRGKKSPLGYKLPKSAASSATQLVHYPELAVPWEVLETTADVLLDDPRIASGIFPKVMERRIIVNLLRILSSILLDLVLSSSVSLHGGVLEMKWTFHPEKWREFFASMDRTILTQIVQDALEEIDFDVVEREAKKAVKAQGITLYGEVQLYAMAYKMMLIMFYFFHLGTECRFLGRSVRQHFVRPSKAAAMTRPAPDA